MRTFIHKRRLLLSLSFLALSVLAAVWHVYVGYRGVLIGEHRIELAKDLADATILECTTGGAPVAPERRGDRYVFTHKGDGHLFVTVQRAGRSFVVDCGYIGPTFDDFYVDSDLTCGRSYKGFFRL